MLNDVNLVDRIVDDLVGSLGRLHRLHLVDDVVEHSVCVLEVSKEWQLSQSHLDKLHVFVSIQEDAFLDASEDLLVLETDIIEVSLGHLSNGRVFLGDDRCSGHTLIDEGDLTEKLTLT